MDKIARICQEIKRLRKKIKDNKDPLAPNQKAGYLFALADMESFLNTLSEESGVDVTDFCKPIDPGIAQCVADHWWEMLDEEPDKSLEEAAREFAKDAYPDKHNLVWMFKRGAEWQKSQMMKEAVEGEAHPDDCEIWVNLVGYGYKFNEGDKVRIIIVKEENK